jgi:hypothetical protein
MTHKIGNLLVIVRQAPEQCEFCPAVAECRPYGPGGKKICGACMEKPEYKKEVRRRMEEFILGRTTH